MHKEFGDWYREARIEPNADLLENRWKALANFLNGDEGQRDRALDLLRVYYGLRTQSPIFAQEFREALQTTDKAFPLKGNDLEVQILAGAGIAELMSDPTDPMSQMVALAALCCGGQGVRQRPTEPNVPALSSQFLADASKRLRVPDRATPFRKFQPPGDDKLAELLSAGQADQTPQAFEIARNYLAALTKNTQTWATSVTKTIETLRTDVALQREETNIVWWLISGSSRNLDRAYLDLSPEMVCLLCALELAELTENTPGPLAAVAFLDRQLTARGIGRATEWDIAHVVNSLPTGQRQNLITKSVTNIDDVCLIHTALIEGEATSSPGAWVEAFEKKSGLSAAVRMTPVQFSMQFYREKIFSRLFNALEEK